MLNLGGLLADRRSEPVKVPQPKPKLPDEAEVRLVALKLDADALHTALVKAGQDREQIKTLLGQASLNADRMADAVHRERTLRVDDPSFVNANKQVETLQNEYAAAERLRHQRSEKWRSFHSIVQRTEFYTNTFIGQLTEFKGRLPAPKSGESPWAVVQRVRSQMVELSADLILARDAPRPSSEARAEARRQVDALAKRGAPNVLGLVKRGDRIVWPKLLVEAEKYVELIDFHALIHFAARDQLVAAIDREIAAIADDKNALSAAARAKRLDELEAAILLAGRVEEDAIRQAAKQGQTIERRPDADPRAILACDGPAPRE